MVVVDLEDHINQIYYIAVLVSAKENEIMRLMTHHMKWLIRSL
jgi:hypothetical protein